MCKQKIGKKKDVVTVFWLELQLTTYLGKSCSFGLLFINLNVIRVGCGMWLYKFLIIAFLFILNIKTSICKDINFFQEISHCHNKYEAIPIVLLGNKADLEDKRQVRLKDGIKVGLNKGRELVDSELVEVPQ